MKYHLLIKGDMNKKKLNDKNKKSDCLFSTIPNTKYFYRHFFSLKEVRKN